VYSCKNANRCTIFTKSSFPGLIDIRETENDRSNFQK
jgi:hypothetical protein